MEVGPCTSQKCVKERMKSMVYTIADQSLSHSRISRLVLLQGLSIVVLDIMAGSEFLECRCRCFIVELIHTTVIAARGVWQSGGGPGLLGSRKAVCSSADPPAESSGKLVKLGIAFFGRY